MLGQTSTAQTAGIHEALSRAERDRTVTVDDAEILFAARGADLERLLELASSLRDEGLERSGRSGVITYSKKVFIPVTHLCRDRCHYCIFVETPGKLATKGKPLYMSPDEILEVARAGAALGCKEALFTLGDRPEDRWPQARAWLDEHGYASTIEYIREMAIRVLEETGLLPHLNPGVMTWAEIQRLRPTAPSMGMMLETTSVRLWAEKGAVHYGSPDKDPALRLRVLDDAGRARVPFTTGVLLGIGENDRERAESLVAIRESHERHGHIQETIVQNFRAKPRTAMQNEVDLALQEYVAAVAVARVVMGPDATVQAPPNLTDANELALLVRAGIDDWGGVSPLTADHVNPERPWPEIEELARLTRDTGFELRERLTAHPQFIHAEEEWIDERVRPHLRALAEPSGLAAENAPVVGRPWLLPEPAPVAFSALTGAVASALRAAADDPASLRDDEYAVLLEAQGADLDALCRLADEVRRDAVGDDVTFVVNRNIDSSLFVGDGTTPEPAHGSDASTPRLTLATIGDLADEAWALGASEVCVQGRIPAHLPGTAYLELIAEIRRRQPGLHLHAFRPTEIADGVARCGVGIDAFLAALRASGVDTVPGTGARILDDRLRGILSGHTDPPASEWVRMITAAHRAGLRSTATMVYGHVETPLERVAHLRTLARIQDETGGFTEFIPMPFVASEGVAPLPGGSRPAAGLDVSRAVVAVSRLLLHGRIANVQASWTKIGLRGARLVLQGGANDFGGLLLDGARWPGAGAEAHRELSIADVEGVASDIGRQVRQRATDYGTPPLERLAAARAVVPATPERFRLPLITGSREPVAERASA